MSRAIALTGVAFRASAGETFDLPAGFLITPQQPHRYNIVWADSQTRTDVLDQLRPVQEEWANAVVATPPTTEEERYALWGATSRGSAHVQAHAELTRLCYWDGGDYTLELRVTTSRPEEDFTRSWRFHLTDQDAQLLRLNAITILRGVANFNDIPYNFAYPAYEPA
jgi:hypothetical protein